MAIEKITIVEFPEPVNGSTRHYFTSLTAIFDYFPYEAIGRTADTLMHYKIGAEPYDTGKCKISRHHVNQPKKKKQ